MGFSSAFIDQLATLTDALDDPVIDLHAIVSVLTDDVTAAVPSFLGLSITAYLPDDVVTFSTMDAPVAGTSLLLSLSVGDPECEVVLYAARPGAFAELAADSRTSGLDLPGQVILDGHLPPPTARLYRGESIGIAELSHINQAIGVLIAGGLTAAAARTLLQQDADEQGTALVVAAQRQLSHLP